MISYNTRDWLSNIFRFHKADTFRKLLPLITFVCLYSWLIAYLETEVFKLSALSHVKNISLMHNLLGFVISMLLVFRTNTAYDRWWEGRKLWGSLVNNSRNFALKLAAIIPGEDEHTISFFRKIIPAYASALKNHLRHESTRTALFDTKSTSLLGDIDHEKHVPNQIAGLMITRIIELNKEGKISGDQLIILNSEIQSFTEICGGCERIKNTPIPYSYSVFLKKFIFTYIMTLPFGFVFSLGYIVIPVVGFIFYVLASLELIAEEIEDPFGGDPNDVPTDKLAENIQIHVHEIL
ncbi:MAG: bestrophin family protein [Chitinophagaceae bacterium]